MRDPLSPRLARELETITAMVRMYCDAHHQREGRHPCPTCRELIAYAGKRLANCRFQEQKPTCGNCTVHCYAPRFREQVRAVMRFAGPRMIVSHPLMAIRHLLDGRRRMPAIDRHRHQHGSISTTENNEEQQ